MNSEAGRETINVESSGRFNPMESAPSMPYIPVEKPDHIVQFYEDEEFLMKSVAAYIGAGLREGGAGIVIATRAHRSELERCFEADGIDVAAFKADGRLIVLDAADTLSQFMVNGTPDEELFHDVIAEAASKCTKNRSGLRAFGEMVALLWADKNGAAAIRLEEFWNDFAKQHSLSLLCAYPINGFNGSAHFEAFARICKEHSRIIPAESYVWQTDDEQHRTIALLQQKANSLEGELAENKRLREKERYLAAIVESSDDAIISKDLEGIITSWNKGAERIFGYTADEIIGKPVTTLMPQNHQDEEPVILDRIRRGVRIDHYETIRQRKDGSLVNISLTVSPVKNDQGKIIGASKIARDVTDRKQAEKKLAESLEREHAARQMAEAAARAKDDFLAALSHELRTPLTPVLLIASDFAENPNVPDEIRAQFGAILKNVEVESRLIDDLLDLARINRGKPSLNLHPVDAHTILCEAVKTVQAQIDSKRIQATFNLRAEKCIVTADPIRLQQIFWNVLKNAVKFTPEGGRIDVETSLRDGQFNLRITDSGIGMTPEELKRIFAAFTQGDHSKNNSHRYGGLGLGLAISRKLVELHSGRIAAFSKGRNQGATFTIDLPLTEA